MRGCRTGLVSCSQPVLESLSRGTDMRTAALMALLIMGSLAVGQSTDAQSTETGFVGERVLLPCSCSDEPKELAWQIGDRLVSHYTQNENDSSPIDESYINRTQLFLNVVKTNCSLLLMNLSLVDAGVYSCHVLTIAGTKVWTKNSSDVNLTVSEHVQPDSVTQKRDHTHFSAAHVGIPVLLLVIILAAGLLLHRRQGQKKIIIYQEV